MASSSTAVTKDAPAQAAQPKAGGALPPVPLLNGGAAVAAAAVQPLLLGALFVWRFDALVADPVMTLQLALPVVAIVQAGFLISCFPPAGSQNVAKAKKTQRGKKKEVGIPMSVATAILALLLTTLAVPALYILFVLFGAPFLTLAPHTLLCCAHFAVLAIYPILYVRGSDLAALKSVIGVTAPLDQSFGGLAGAVIGAWLGAVPIPLDWDREWQKWPVTIVVGIYAGYIVGAKLLGTVLYGSRWAQEESRPKEE